MSISALFFTLLCTSAGSGDPCVTHLFLVSFFVVLLWPTQCRLCRSEQLSCHAVLTIISAPHYLQANDLTCMYMEWHSGLHLL